MRLERRARNELVGLLAPFLITLAVSLAKGQDVFVFAYIMAVVVAVGGPRRLDVGGVMLDGVFFGLIYARTHNLWVTWATHYAADVVGVIALVAVFRVM